MRNLTIATLVISGIIVLNQLRFLGRSTLALVILVLAVVTILQGVVLLDLLRRQRP